MNPSQWNFTIFRPKSCKIMSRSSQNLSQNLNIEQNHKTISLFSEETSRFFEEASFEDPSRFSEQASWRSLEIHHVIRRSIIGHPSRFSVDPSQNRFWACTFYKKHILCRSIIVHPSQRSVDPSWMIQLGRFWALTVFLLSKSLTKSQQDTVLECDILTLSIKELSFPKLLQSSN